MTFAFNLRQRSPSTESTTMLGESIEGQGFGENISDIVTRRNIFDNNGCRRELGAKPMVLDSQRLGSWCHAWRIGVRESQSRGVVFKDSRHGANFVSEMEIENCVNFKEQTTKVDQRSHGHAEADVFTLHRGKANLLNPFGFPENWELA